MATVIESSIKFSQMCVITLPTTINRKHGENVILCSNSEQILGSCRVKNTAKEIQRLSKLRQKTFVTILKKFGWEI